MSAPVAGRYHLIKKLAAGGMAEVFLARQQGKKGFEKLVCLKRILPGYADNPDFVRMFVDEARVAADLRHPNLVSVFDAGEDEGSWFIVMEYLEGHDVASIIRQAHARGAEVPVAMALQVVADAARGLHAAHVKTDLEGRAMQIVHRDVSPQNLFVTKDGITKVLDFGVARSAHRSSKTEVGIVKGKLGYVSPEQLESVELDGRSDLYSLGVVLWELLVLERLFARASDAEVLRAIIEGRVPAPSTKRKGLPKDLDALVLEALALDRDKRFASCEAFATALEDFLVELKTPSSPSRLTRWLGSLFDGPPTAAPAPPPIPLREEKTKTRKVKAGERKKEPTLEKAEDFLGAVEQFLGRASTRKTNLVPSAGPFIGRENDLEALKSSFDEGARLVTLVGFGGMGKTRLAQQFAASQLPQYEADGGVWFVDLAECRSLEQVSKAVAAALDVQVPMNASSGATVTHASRTLKSLGRALVVLDNFEQLVPLAQSSVGVWLSRAPELRLLVTSREALSLADEVVQPLEPLPVGGVESAAMQLFRAHAEKVRPRALTRPELDDVAIICERLEGHPLALELAASRLSELSVREVKDRLRERFDLLGGRARQATRHATLWNTIDWSWQLLSAAEQQALSQLSVFRGGFTVEAASAVIDVSRHKGSTDPITLLRALHRKSLVRYFAVPSLPKELRLGLLESIHEFAAEKLAASDDAPRARHRHATHYLQVGRAWATAVANGTSLDALTHLEVERENLTEVFDRALSMMPPTQATATTALGALEALEPVFLRKGPFSSHLALLDDALTVGRNVGVKMPVIARAMQQRGNLQRTLGRPALAVEELSRAMSVVESSGERALEGRIRRDLAVARFVSGDVESARDWLVSALSAARASKDDALALQTLSSLAIVQVAMGDLDEAALCCDEGLPLARKRGDSTTEARLLGSLGTIYQEQEKLDLALTFFSEAVARASAVRDVRLEGYFTGKRAGVLLARGELDAAQGPLEEAITRLAEVGDLRHEGLFLTYLAAVQMQRGHFSQARVTLSAAEARLEAVKDPLSLTALALRRMHVEVAAKDAGPKEARALLSDVRAARGSRRARTSQSEEVRIAARALEAALEP
ncbi:MAG: protein kinase [Myxococcales bacterium]|nr:protein kinase [Myxococcales bacterium]